MSYVLKRIQEINKKKPDSTPAAVKDEMVSMYVADLEEKAREKAYADLCNQLIESADEAEEEAMEAKVSGLEKERDLLKNFLQTAQSEITQLKDLVKSLKANENQISIALRDAKKIVETERIEMTGRIHALEVELAAAKAKPAPVVSSPTITMPSLPEFELVPVRNSDGYIQSATVRPKRMN